VCVCVCVCGLNDQEKCIWGQRTERDVWGMDINQERCMWERMSVRDVCQAMAKKVSLGPDD
jgi:hypothetical protein